MEDRHIARFARTLIGKLRVTWKQAVGYEDRDGKTFTARSLYGIIGEDVWKEVSRMRPEKMGQIGVQGLAINDPRTKSQPQKSGVTNEGKTSLWEVLGFVHMNRTYSGRNQLIVLATAALIAEMTDQLREKMHEEARRNPLTSEVM